MDMKAKLKTPEIAQKKGQAHVKATLKKLFKESITEKTQFFYDSEFDYGEDLKTGQQVIGPLLYIGEIPSAWKKWIKANGCKTSKTFALGECLFDSATKILKLKVQIGKGAKNPVLKIIMKELCKPFARPGFVESLDSGEVMGLEDETTTEADSGAGEGEATDTPTPQEIAEAIKSLIKQVSDTMKNQVKSIVSAIKSKDVKAEDVDVMDELIDAIEELKENFEAAEDRIKNALKAHYDKIMAMKPQIEKIKAAVEQIWSQISGDGASSDNQNDAAGPQNNEVFDKLLKKAEKALKKAEAAVDKAIAKEARDLRTEVQKFFGNLENLIETVSEDLVEKGRAVLDRINKVVEDLTNTEVEQTNVEDMVGEEQPNLLEMLRDNHLK